MRTIAIDAVGIALPGGGRSATLNVLRELLRLDTASRYLLLLDQPEPDLALGSHVQQVIVPIRHRLLSRLWGQIVWPFALRRAGVDLVHHIKNLTTWGLPGRSVVTIYDMTIPLHPDLYPLSDVLYWRHIQPRMLRRADRIVAISRATADDLVRVYGLDARRITIVHPAYAPGYRPAPNADVARVRRAYAISERYILHVGSLSRKKNLLTLLKAWELLCERGYTGQLILVGRRYSKGHDRAFYEHLASSPQRERVILTGSVPDDDMPALYSGADLMVFPSLHEGFGIVPLEAMACGTPVIASDAGALGETVGEGGVILKDPADPEAMARAAWRLLEDDDLRAGVASAGRAWAKRYSTESAAIQTLAVYDKVLSS